MARKYPLGLLPDSSPSFDSLVLTSSTHAYASRDNKRISSHPVIFNVHAPVCELLVADKTGISYCDFSFSTDLLSGYWSLDDGSRIFQQLWDRFVKMCKENLKIFVDVAKYNWNVILCIFYNIYIYVCVPIIFHVNKNFQVFVCVCICTYIYVQMTYAMDILYVYILYIMHPYILFKVCVCVCVYTIYLVQKLQFRKWLTYLLYLNIYEIFLRIRDSRDM